MSSETKIIFVTGASRSGTTMLSRMFGAHSQVLRLRELHYFGDLCDDTALDTELDESELVRLCASLYGRVERGVWRGEVTESERRKAAQTVAALPGDQRTGAGVFRHTLMAVAAAQGKRIVCDHTPRNIFYAKRLLAAFPDCRIVHVVRDARAVLASQKNRWRQRGMGRNNIPISEVLRNRLNYHPLTMTRLWARANQTALGMSDHERVLLTRFEDLVGDAQSEMTRICSFLSLDYQDQMLQVPQMGSSHIRNEDDKGVSDTVVHQWMKVLNRGEIIACEKSAGELMKNFSYSPSADSEKMSIPLLVQYASYPLHLVGVLASNPRRAWIQLKALLKGAASR